MKKMPNFYINFERYNNDNQYTLDFKDYRKAKDMYWVLINMNAQRVTLCDHEGEIIKEHEISVEQIQLKIQATLDRLSNPKRVRKPVNPDYPTE